MTLHVFNPEHDIALAVNKERFTPPHAARELRQSLSFLPAIWARRGDFILVDDKDFAVKAAKKHKHYSSDFKFLEATDLRHLFNNVRDFDRISVDVWGWDVAVRRQLLDCGVPLAVLPTPQQLSKIRELSSRHTAVRLLKEIRKWAEREAVDQIADCLVGQSEIARNADDVMRYLEKEKHIIVKAPWSSSGRGVKFFREELSASQNGWLRNTLRNQQTVILEPYYRKMCDFGLEFFVNADGSVDYQGLSLFFTDKTAWLGNIIAQEEEKREMLSHYLSFDVLDAITKKWEGLLFDVCHNAYTGPVGIDMMIVPAKTGIGFGLHPCIEINFRRTMGHVAIALTPQSLSDFE